MQPMINTLLDPVVNFGKVTVLGGHTDGIDDTEVTLITGDGSKLPNPVPSGSFNLVWFNNSTYSDPADDPYVEIVRCIARVGDTLTLMRGQELTARSNKNIPTKIYKMILSPTKKTIDDIQTESQSKINTHSALSTGIHGVGADTIDGVGTRNAAISTHSSVTSNVHGFDILGDAPAQIHGILRHTGTIGAWANIDKTTSDIADITTRSHTSLTDIGTNTHATIDTAISNLTTHIGASIAHGVTSDIVGISDSQILTNKTLTSPLISTIYGGSAANDDITIEGTSNATKASSYVILQPTSGNVGIGTAVPTAKLHIGGTSGVDGIKFPDGTLQTSAASGAGYELTANKNTANGYAGLNASALVERIRVQNVDFTTGADIYYASDAQSGAANTTSYTLCKQITLNNLPSATLRISFNLEHAGTSGQLVYGKIYRNGGAVGTERTHALSDPYWATFIENIAGWSEGDLLQIYAKKSTDTTTAYISTLRILCKKGSGVMTG